MPWLRNLATRCYWILIYTNSWFFFTKLCFFSKITTIDPLYLLYWRCFLLKLFLPNVISFTASSLVRYLHSRYRTLEQNYFLGLFLGFEYPLANHFHSFWSLYFYCLEMDFDRSICQGWRTVSCKNVWLHTNSFVLFRIHFHSSAFHDSPKIGWSVWELEIIDD